MLRTYRIGAIIVDLGFISFFLVPGYVSLSHGLPASITWILGVVFASIGYFQARTNRHKNRSASNES